MSEDRALKHWNGKDNNGVYTGQKIELSPEDIEDRQDIQAIWAHHIGGNAALTATDKEWSFFLALYRA